MAVALHVVKPGDQIFKIMQQHYGRMAFLADQSELVVRLQKNNPHIPDIDVIYPGQVVAMPDMHLSQPEIPLLPVEERLATSQICKSIGNLDAETRSFMPIFDTQKVFSSAGEGFIDFAKRASSEAIDDVKKVGLSYYQMNAGTISRNQYNYRRKVSLKNVDAKLGPLRAGFTPGKTAHQTIRINPKDSIRTSAILKEIKTLERTVKLAKYGGVVLKVASLAHTGVQIGLAANNQERTVIVVDAVFSIAGATAGTVIAVALVGTPVGWLAIAGIAAAGVAGGFAGEAFGKAVIENTLYDENGNRLNTQADNLWRSFYAE